MAKRAKLTREELLEAAVDLIRESGADALNARTLAKRAGVSTQPIFTHFAGMQDLKNACLQRAVNLYEKRIREEVAADPDRPFRAMGMGYIRFAREEKELFRWLFMGDGTKEASHLPESTEPVQALRQTLGLSEAYYKQQPSGTGGAIANANAILQKGETRLNGVRINPTTTTYRFDGPQVFSQVGPGSLANGNAPVFNTFFNDRNQGTVTQGGGRLHEVLVFDCVLSNEEREAVEDYLAQKWLGAPIDHAATGLTAPVVAEPDGDASYARLTF